MNKEIKHLASWLRENVTRIAQNPSEQDGCYYDLRDRDLCVALLWEPGFGNEVRDDCLQLPTNLDYALCVGIKVINPYDCIDDWYSPYDAEDGEVISDTSPISMRSDFESWAESLLDDYHELDGKDIETDGKVSDPEDDDDDPEDDDDEDEDDDEEDDSTDNGWHGVKEVTDFFDQIAEYNYELKNCIRGCETDCTTNEELATLLRSLKDDIDELADKVERLPRQTGRS